MDRQTFDRLVLEQLPAAQRLAVRLTGKTETAEDVVQTALVRAASSWHGFRGESGFRAWFLQIVVNAFRDDLAKRKRRSAPPLKEDIVDGKAIDPGESAAAREMGIAAARAVSSLPPRQREVMVLHTYEQLSDAEVAAVLGMSPQNVRTTLHLARAHLREVLAQYLKEDAR